MKKLMIILLIWINFSFASNYYVDKNASGQNNGTTWANAWQSFSAINWNTIQPGDIIYISGGTDSTVYYQRLVIGKSGTPGNYITIRNSYDTGHNGKVIIEDPNTNSFDGCIYLSNRDYIYIKGIETRKGIRACYLYTLCDYVTIDSCIFRNWYPNGSTGGLKIEGNDNFPDALNCTNIEIKNCIIESLPHYDLNSTDALYGQGVHKLKIHNNFIHQRNQSTNNMHVDCIQLYRTADVRIWNNVCIVDSGVTGHGMILGVESRANQIDTMIVYNNYIYAGGHLLPGGDPYINAGYCRWYGQNDHPLSYWIHNTLVTANGGESPLVMEYMPYFKNNIIVQLGTNGKNPANFGGQALATVTSTDTAWCGSCNPPLLVEQCSNNLLWREWAGISFTGQFSGNGNTGTPSGWTGWLNYGGTGVNANPLFVNNVRERNGYIIGSNSPAINAGQNLQSFIESKGLPWTDIDGNLRDSSPDVGAYQFSSGNGTTFSLSVQITHGANFVSVPGINPDGMGVNTWWAYRDMSTEVFSYSNGYQPVTTMTPGIGYWMKNSGSRIYNTGDEWPATGILKVAHNPINGISGWNLIGGYESIVSSANVTTNPPGLRTGLIYKYYGGYQPSSTMNPGFGYWIKLSGAGQIIIPETLAKGEGQNDFFPDDWGRIIITDAEGASYTLYSVKGEVNLSQYELPPVLDEDLYDFRFSSGRIAEDLENGEHTIQMRGIKYPIKVKVENLIITLQDDTGKKINVVLRNEEDVLINDNSIDKLRVVHSKHLIPFEYLLEQNFPNPFNPSTVIKFSLPEETNVTLKIYNLLGEKITELVNDKLEAGNYSYTWNAQSSASGVYFYELRTEKFVSFKKMILLQ